MAETRRYEVSWISVYKESTADYQYSSTPIRTGGAEGYHSYIGFPSHMRTDLQTSKITPKIFLSIGITEFGQFDFGAHKVSYHIKSSGSNLPFYEYIGISGTRNEGRQRIDITNIRDRFENQGFQGLVLYGRPGFNLGVASGKTNNSATVYLEVEGDWNDPPSKPSITFPNGGETLNGVINLTTNPATDVESPQSELRYQWAIFDGTWNYLPLTNNGVTNVTVNLDDYRESSVARVGVRAVDPEGEYGAWDYSDGVFTIQHNIPPLQPTELYPRGGITIDRSKIQRFSWRHNDQDNQSKYDIQWRLQGNSVWNVISGIDTQEFYYFPSNILPLGIIEWRVRTYDQGGLVGPYSATSIFKATDPSEKPNIISPIDLGSIATANPTIQWSSVDQVEYQIEIYNGNTLHWSYGALSKNRAQTVLNDLENLTSYEIRVRIRKQDGLWSDWDIINVTTAFIPPPQPILEINSDNENAMIIINIQNPLPTGDEQEADKNVIYRRELGVDEWIKLKDDIEVNGSFIDYTPASGRVYQYMVEAWSENDTYIASAIYESNILIQNVILSSTSDYSVNVSLEWNPSKSFNYGFDVTLMSFQGRKDPVAEFGSSETFDGSLKYTIRSYEELMSFINLLERKDTLLYRDSRKRREFVTINGCSVDDVNPSKYEVSFNMNRVYFKEDIE